MPCASVSDLNLLKRPVERSPGRSHPRTNHYGLYLQRKKKMRPFTLLTRSVRLLISLVITTVPFLSIAAQKTNPKVRTSVSSTSPASRLALSYTLSFPQPHTHLYEVSLTIDNVSTPQID